MDLISSLNTALEGRYRLEREIGSGGMATVYLAEDVKHHRQVAIKVVRQDVTASMGAERFLREIEIAAQLQHPNILPLLDSGEADGVVFYVMPFIDGPTLGARLQREGELPIQEVVRLLIGIVDALGHAHAHGVVHRDVKPDNVMLSGRHALVADFGVARAVTSASEAADLTTMGVALGTPAYMAPEQAAADPLVDHRADLYAVGIVAYEMLTGQTPFRANTPQQILAAQVTQTPTPVRDYRPGVSPELEQLVMRCLEKRPANRWQSAAELLSHLEGLGTPSGGMTPTSVQLPPVGRPGRTKWYAAAGVVAAAAVAGVALQAGWLSGGAAPPPVLGQSTRVTSMERLEINPSLSPDGSLLAYTAGTTMQMRVYIQPVAGGRVIPLSEDSSAFEFQPRWSPDGTQIMYLTRDGARVASSLGGVSRLVAGVAAAGASSSSTAGLLGAMQVTAAAWSPDGETAFIARGGRMSTVPVAGGDEVSVGEVAYELHSCEWSRAGGWVACASGNHEGVVAGPTYGNIAPSSVVLVNLADGTVHELTDRLTANGSPAWSPDGRRLFYLSNAQGPADVFAVDIGRDGTARGTPQRMTTGLEARTISFSADGTRIAYDEFTARSNIWSMPIPTTTVDASSARQLTSGDQVVETTHPSPDGRWLLYDSNLYGNSDIFRIPIEGGPAERLTSDPADEFAGALSPDGSEIAYHTWKTGTRDIAIKPLNGQELLLTRTEMQESYPRYSPGGQALEFNDQRILDGVRGGVYVARREASGGWGEPELIRPGGGSASWLSDDQLLVQLRGEIELLTLSTGESRVLYRASPGSDGPHSSSSWPSDDGSLVYFKSHDDEGRASFWSVPVSGGAPTLLVRFDDLTRLSSRVDFGVGAGQFFFTIDERRSDIWVAEIIER